jgi:hypothetical protein
MIVAPSKYRFLFILPLAALVIAFSAFVCKAAEPCPETKAVSGNKQLLLYAKNPSTWKIVKTGAGGKMIYRESTGPFSLKAFGLSPRTEYALVRYADAPPGAEILARGMSDDRGRLNMTGVWRNWTRKFWLVLGEDVVGKAGKAGSMRAWRPDRYLFEEKPIGIDCVSLNSEKMK